MVNSERGSGEKRIEMKKYPLAEGIDEAPSTEFIIDGKKLLLADGDKKCQ